ncbi:hypothetical protein B0T17DRAFT_488307 [Bombardia bombarda]|uniref:Ubiquitin carboxyl-terminal hydrolase n=1 Tax=Bombardia bombarda TaxID=252184 RepID=A0AA39X6B8_9PEZI|nr:hypothetical protein B0T17DRAFT_488307 [Bombardia bombarda]
MPDKSLTVATYAAGASLAAITLIYVFGPTYFFDSDPAAASSGVFSSRKKGVVGLSNPANDCFINSVLQALAGLGDLRLYLIRETHRRSLADEWIYAQAVPPGVWECGDGEAGGPQPSRKNIPDWKLEGLQAGLVTKGLKDILDSLNERPIYKKTISALPFVKTLEQAFRQRISRQQQDAQEFLQVVAERLCDEYHAGRRARKFAQWQAAGGGKGSNDGETDESTDETEEGFPLEGKFESQIECLTCKFKPRPTESTFCSLTLNVPQASATTLNACFDGMFKTEYIDDFKCEKCRLLHAVAVLEVEAHKSTSDSFKATASVTLKRLRLAIETDPEKVPEDISLPDLRYAPKRRIARHIRLTEFPKIMAIHLSRSIFDASNLSHKNSAKVAFPEQLSLGGLLNQRKYKLLGLVTHKGSHHSGHYESFRRQNIYPPFSNPHTFQASGAYTTADLSSPESGTNSSTPSLDSAITPPAAAAQNSTPVSVTQRTGLRPSHWERDTDTSSLRSVVAASARTTLSRIASRPSSHVGTFVSPKEDAPLPSVPLVGKSKQRKLHDRWWRISDDKVKEASTRDVLSMQREVYLLFYELEREAS